MSRFFLLPVVVILSGVASLLMGWSMPGPALGVVVSLILVVLFLIAEGS